MGCILAKFFLFYQTDFPICINPNDGFSYLKIIFSCHQRFPFKPTLWWGESLKWQNFLGVLKFPLSPSVLNDKSCLPSNTFCMLPNEFPFLLQCLVTEISCLAILFGHCQTDFPLCLILDNRTRLHDVKFWASPNIFPFMYQNLVTVFAYLTTLSRHPKQILISASVLDNGCHLLPMISGHCQTDAPFCLSPQWWGLVN